MPAVTPTTKPLVCAETVLIPQNMDHAITHDNNARLRLLIKFSWQVTLQSHEIQVFCGEKKIDKREIFKKGISKVSSNKKLKLSGFLCLFKRTE